MAEVLGEKYMYEYILTFNKSICGIIQESHLWFKEYIKTMTLRAGFKQCRNNPFILYRLNELGTLIVIIYIYGML